MRIYIAEDEPLAAAKLKFFLEKLGEGPDISLFDNGMSVLAAINRETPDVLFLDIQMPEITGMQLLERLPAGELQVIITTAYDQYALPAFGFQVADYLLKPITIERLSTALAKVKETLRLRQLDREIHAATLSIRCDGRDETLHASNIVCLESLKDYVRISLFNGQNRMVLAPLHSFEQQLPAEFVRIHRSAIINRRAIASIDGNEVTMSNGQRLTIGKTYRNILK
ncbi:MAG: LytTR family DNA-binding domain-containing protein [Bacteroidales bacterium]|nr:LytTR family DNA-binding domain-containing protein [Bacteroidales bacterium]